MNPAELSFLAVKPRRHRRRQEGSSPTPAPPAPLVLVSATFDPDGPIIYLTFDRAVDVSGVDTAVFEVLDGDNNSDFVGFEGAGQNDPTQCYVPMHSAGPYSGTGATATVGAGNGIVAVDDGGTWEGVADLGLPWP
jgi:hypothetical protein